MRKLEEYFVATWCLFMPVMSLLVIPSLQGSIIPYLMAFLSIALVVLKFALNDSPGQISAYIRTFLLITLVWLLLFGGSQLGDLINPQIHLDNVPTISNDAGLLMRASLFTQSLYFTACVFIALYFRYFFRPEWIRYIFLGAWSFALYGLYDWLFFLVFHTSGDFIANRTFAGGDHPGSWSQPLDLGGLSLLRLKSFLGEPSFVSAVVIPYLLLAMETGRRRLTAVLLVVAILTTSTTVYLGMAISILIYMLRRRTNLLPAFSVFFVLGLVVLALSVVFPDVFRGLFQDKFSGDTDSGKIRMNAFADFFALFGQFAPVNWLFGVGFGYTYSELACSLTANIGLIGDAAVLFAFLKPIIFLSREPFAEALRMSLISILVVIGLSLTESFIPTTWMILGLAFWQLDRQRQEAVYFTPAIAAARMRLQT